MDDGPRQDFEPVIRKAHGEGERPAKPTEYEALSAEFLRKLLKKGDIVSVIQDVHVEEATTRAPATPPEAPATPPVEPAADQLVPAPPAAYGEVPQRKCYEIIDIVHSRNRPHLLPTRSSKQHVTMTASMSLHVQHYDIWAHEDDDKVTVSADVDGEWFDGVSFVGSKARCLQILRWTANPSETGGCLDLADPRPLSSAIPLLDAECPTLILVAKLEERRWRPVTSRAVHDSTTHHHVPQDYDDRDKIQSRYYLQCCVNWHQVSDSVPDTMPSREPQLYYRLLLAGKSVEPAMGNEHYKLVWRDEGEPEPVPLEDLGSDEEHRVVHALQAPPPKGPGRHLDRCCLDYSLVEDTRDLGHRRLSHFRHHPRHLNHDLRHLSDHHWNAVMTGPTF